MSYVNSWSAYSKCRDAFADAYNRTVGEAFARSESRALWCDMLTMDSGLDVWYETVGANDAAGGYSEDPD